MLDRLEASGHIRRVYDQSDRRTVKIVLTDSAKGLKDKYNAVSSEMNEIFYKGFNDEEILAFEEKLGKILENLIEKENENGQKNHI